MSSMSISSTSIYTLYGENSLRHLCKRTALFCITLNFQEALVPHKSIHTDTNTIHKYTPYSFTRTGVYVFSIFTQDATEAPLKSNIWGREGSVPATPAGASPALDPVPLKALSSIFYCNFHELRTLIQTKIYSGYLII